MSVNPKTFFAFARPLPAPFESAPKKCSVASKHSTNTEATLSTSMIKAVHAYIGCISGSGKGGVGVADSSNIVEYKSGNSDDEYHLAAYTPQTGFIAALVYNKSTEAGIGYSLTESGRDGSALLMALMPTLMGDEEFSDAFKTYMSQRQNGYSDMTIATSQMALMCDNAYRRVMDETCPAHIKLNIERSGNVTPIRQAQISAGTYTPETVLAGEFVILAQTGPASVIKPAGAIDHRDFIGKYLLNPTRRFNVREALLIPKLPEWYIIPQEVISVCKHAQKTTEKAKPMRNFLLRGPAGTGKTEGARAIAAGLNLPYVSFTCSANTEIFDMVGQVFPDTVAATTGDAQLDQERDMLLSMGGITYDNVAQLMHLPDMDDMDYNPVGVYEAITGTRNPNATSQECMHIVMERVTEKIQRLSQVRRAEEKQSYIYIETDFIKALKHGYLIEIQEPAVIMQPGVLVGLNSLLEQAGSITLPTGEVIQRHPDAVVVITTNTSYEGCRVLNQSVVDRMSLVQDIELPSPEVMAKRAMSITGFDDEFMISEMVGVVNTMATYMRQNNIVDGSCGMRSLIDWIISTEITGDPYTSALYTIISKATADEDDRNALIDAVLKPCIPQKLRAVV